jgi:hypothetical protein
MKTRIAIAVALVALFGAAAACSDSDSDSATTTTTTPQGFEVQTPDGQVSLSLSGQLPPNWPDDFPVPSDSEPAGSGSLGGSTSTGFVGVYSTTGTPEDAYNFYKDNSELDVTSSSSLGSGSTYLGTVQFEGEWNGLVTVLPYNGETLIVIVLNTQTGTTLPGVSTNDTSSAT